MDEIRNAIGVIETLEDKYALSMDETNCIREQFEDFKVYIPLIGRFSVGKSALINNLLDYGDIVEVCKENIAVETAIPTEVFWGTKEEECACICRPQKEYISMGDFLEIRDTISVENAETVKLQLNNEVLEKFPSIALVDMPGLDSGYEVHDKAIENYIRKSMSYILVFSADELTIPESMEPILADLNAYHMPMCVVITKGNRISGAEEQRKSELREQLKKYFAEDDFPIFVTERENGYPEELVDYLTEMESKANDLGRKYYTNKLEPEFARICNYLDGYLKNLELSMSELEVEQNHLQADIEKLNHTVDDELRELEAQIPKMIGDIAGDVQVALSNKREVFVSELMRDNDITNEINETVREALTESYQNRVTESIRKHLNKISDVISLGSANDTSVLKIDMDKVCGKEISGIGRTAFVVIGYLFGGPVWAIIAGIVTGLINKGNREKRNEAEMKIWQQLSSSVFPRIDKEVRDKVEIDLNAIILEVRRTVEKDVAAQIEVLQKSLDEVIQGKKEEDALKESKQEEIEADFEQIKEVRAEIIGE
jgi:hypothetical protein